MLQSWGRPLGSWASFIAQSVKNLPAMQETQLRSLGQEDPLEKEMAAHSSIPAWRIPWTEEPGSPWGRKNWTRLSNYTTTVGKRPVGLEGIWKVSEEATITSRREMMGTGTSAVVVRKGEP